MLVVIIVTISLKQVNEPSNLPSIFCYLIYPHHRLAFFLAFLVTFLAADWTSSHQLVFFFCFWAAGCGAGAGLTGATVTGASGTASNFSASHLVTPQEHSST